MADGMINSYEFEVIELDITPSTIVKFFGNFVSWKCVSNILD